MEAELTTLEGKVAQFIELCQRLRRENQDLRGQLAAAEDEKRRLGQKIDAALARLEPLVEQLPEISGESEAE